MKESLPSPENIQRLSEARSSQKDAYETEQTNYLNRKISHIRNSVTNKRLAEAWKTVNEITGRKSSASAKFKATSQDERVQLWKKRFENLLGNPLRVANQLILPVVKSELKIKKGNFSLEELTQALKAIKNAGKACGLDEIPAEIWKLPDFNQILLDLCNSVNNEDPIERWTEGCILPFPSQSQPRKKLSWDYFNGHISKNLQPLVTEPNKTRNRPYLGLMMLYKNTRSMVRSPDGDTMFFDITAGVLQGDTLAPFIFIICLDYVLRKAIDEKTDLGFTLIQRKSRRHPAKKISDADYADDIAVLTDYLEDAAKVLHNIEQLAQVIVLYVNSEKTEYMCLNQDASAGIKSLNGGKVKKVDDFKYLGSYIGTTEQDVNIRIAKAWEALNSLNNIWKSNLPNQLKKNFFRAIVETVLVYGSIIWTLTSSLEKKIDGAYTRMLRAALNVSCASRLTNKDLYGTIPDITSTIRQQRMRFAGHC